MAFLLSSRGLFAFQANLFPWIYRSREELNSPGRDSVWARSIQIIEGLTPTVRLTPVTMSPSEKPLLRTEIVQPPADRATADSQIVQDASLLLVPICFVAIWAGVVCIIADTWKLSRKEVKTNRQLAQYPCKKCQFFNNNPYMKCAVNPHSAMTPAAKDCLDFRSRHSKQAQPYHR
ncbi:hypothetical protein H6F51_14780 [Cyanobacteria bacterium FACHB-DQ100]|nr:hypothetical protein [Cyanobacteria bacterium FACHB-DQ100]